MPNPEALISMCLQRVFVESGRLKVLFQARCERLLFVLILFCDCVFFNTACMWEATFVTLCLLQSSLHFSFLHELQSSTFSSCNTMHKGTLISPLLVTGWIHFAKLYLPSFCPLISLSLLLSFCHWPLSLLLLILQLPLSLFLCSAIVFLLTSWFFFVPVVLALLPSPRPASSSICLCSLLKHVKFFPLHFPKTGSFLLLPATP